MGQYSRILTPLRRSAVDRLLVQYLELDDSERRGFLERCRVRFPRLSHWLEQLVDRSHTVTVLQDSVRHLADDAARERTSSARQTDLPPGTEIGPWRIVEAVGQGGMGMVYRGERADGAFEMAVAVKLIARRKRGLADLLRRECRLLAKLDHPAITRLVDAGLNDRAGPFLVMEWIDGLDLEDWLEESERSLSDRLGLFETLVEATAHAHQRLIVHGDIKPANVRVRSDGGVKLMDFGVARLVGSDATDFQEVRALTPAFAAPEQLEGDEATPGSDIWALGALLFWLLTGQSYTRARCSVHSMIAAAGHGRSRELAAMIEKACADQQQHRYRSAAELLGDLQAFARHQPVSALSHERKYRVEQFVRRNPVLLGGAIATGAALAIGLVATSVMYQQAGMERDRAERHALELAEVVGFQEAQLAGIDAEMMGAEMQSRLRAGLVENEYLSSDPGGVADNWPEQLDGLLSTINFTDFALETLDQAIFDQTRQAIEEQFAAQPVVQAHLLQTLATTLRNIGLVHESIEPQQTALRIRRRELGPAHPDTMDSMMELVHLQAVTGEYEASLEVLEERLELQLPTKGELHRSTLRTINSMGSVYFRLGDLEATQEYYERALEGRLEALGERDGDTAFTMTGLGALYRELGQYEESETMLRRALDIMLELHGQAHHRSRNTLRQLARLMIERDRPDQAETYFRRVLEIERQSLGERHPETLHTLRRLGQFQAGAGNSQEAEVNLAEALAGYRRVLGENHPQTQEARRSLEGLDHL
ncbi:tetratricopeptide repeat protein [Wenzhouxiangella sp. AB-CW3]|uniref:serine/threonine-protein kinase n=1 Tax=Wenzhouxiangella sp. AB-CW3 TaxID=2771012 RepID=UPI00168C0592|nr:serine/threonine-protein kinase [Wenzhouxiangella sp. AB-CW3]QOC21537.1 tetratricopeptide repeat protein [Wenzhouxiangella sp. AB-CW3]